jgi:hypothetical protein
MVMVIGPAKSKVEAKAEAKKAASKSAAPVAEQTEDSASAE